MKRLLLSDSAQADLRSITAFAEERWGREVRLKYAAYLGERMVALCRQPELGPARDDVRPGCRMLRAGSHVVVYRITGAAIEVLRVLHQRMDVRTQMAGRADDDQS